MGIFNSPHIVGEALKTAVFCRHVIKGEDTPFVMELPPYRFPTWKAIGRHTWEKGKQYLRKMGGIIMVASIVVWALGYFPHHEGLTPQQQQEQSYIGHIGKAIEPVFRPQGFNWKLDVGLVSGIGAKEIVASTLGVLYANSDEMGSDDGNTRKYELLHQMMVQLGVRLHFASGSDKNIKLTTKDDLELFKGYLTKGEDKWLK